MDPTTLDPDTARGRLQMNNYPNTTDGRQQRNNDFDATKAELRILRTKYGYELPSVRIRRHEAEKREA